MRWRQRALPVAAGVLAVLIVLGDTLTGDPMLFFRDTLGEYLSLKALQAHWWRDGLLPMWNPFQFAGVPLAANPLTQSFYPPSWLLALPLDVVALFHWILALHVGWAFAGMYRLGRRLGLERGSATVAALAFALSGPLVSTTSTMHYLCAYAWTPWVLAAFERALAKPPDGWRQNAGLAVGIAVPWGMQVLAGDSQAAILTGTALVVRAVAAGWSKQGPVARLRPLAVVLGATALALGLAAIQILPSLELAELSNRSLQTLGPNKLGWALSPARLPELFLPSFYGSLYPEMNLGLWQGSPGTSGRPIAPYLITIYLGAAALALSLLLGRRKPVQPESTWPWRSYALVGSLSLLLSLGTVGGLYLVFDKIVPTWSLYRYPERCLFLAAIPFALAAGFGAQRLAQAPPATWRRRALVLAAVAAAMLLGAGIAALVWESPEKLRPGFEAPIPKSEALWALVQAALALGAISALARWRGKIGRWSTWIAALVVLADLGVAARDQNYRVSRSEILVPSRHARRIKEESPGVVWPRIDRDQRLQPKMTSDPQLKSILLRFRRFEMRTLLNNMGWRYAIAYAIGYSTAQLKTYYAVRTKLPQPRIAEILAMRAIVAPNTGLPPREPCPLRNRLRPIHYDVGDQACTYVLRRPLPRARVVGRALWAANESEALAKLRDARLDLHRATVVLRSAKTTPSKLHPDAHGKARFLQDDPDEVLLEVQASNPALLVLADAHYPGWHAEVDGVRAEIYLADGMMRAVAVPAGLHRVRFYFRSGTVWTGGLLSLLTALVAAAALWLGRRRRLPAP